MSQYAYYLILTLVAGWSIGFMMGKARPQSAVYQKERNFLPFRIFILIAVLIILAAVAYYLKITEPDLKDSELVKIITGGLVIIGLLYSIMTYEANLKKNNLDNRTRRSSTTFAAISDWHKSPLIDYSKIVRQFETGPHYEKLKTNVEAFIIFFGKEKNVDLRRSVIGILNYFETVCAAVDEGLMDEGFVKKFYYSVFLSYYNDWIGYIKRRREIENTPTLWKEFTNLVERWKDSN